MKIFQIKIENYHKQKIIEKISNLLEPKGEPKKPIFAVTLNPEILLTARKRSDYKDIIDSAEFKLVDGFGIKLISWLKKKPIGDRITGADLTSFLIKKAFSSKLKIGIIYLENGLSSRQKIEAFFKKNNFRDFVLLGVNQNNFLQANFSEIKKTDLILVSIGHPNQEILIYKKLLGPSRARLVLGIGGSIDYLTGTQRRAPLWLQEVGLEWLWRLLHQPNRFFRIINALIIFPVLALLKNK